MAQSQLRTALIVGASRGLGLGLAAELTSRRWEVTGTVRDDAGTVRLSAAGARVERVDTTDREALAALRRRLAGEVFDVVFINAGIGLGPDEDATTVGSDAVARLFMANAVAPVAVARALADRVRERSGIIAFMSSDLGSVSRNEDGFMELYRASKAALNSLIRSFTATLGGKRITVLAMHPGWVRTDMGGPHAPLSVEDSVRGLADVLEARAGSGRHAFVDYQGAELEW
jgi:NAD(P)-dependent dehydrogenase (short-subunit alcohol dehydrogenase family)